MSQPLTLLSYCIPALKQCSPVLGTDEVSFKDAIFLFYSKALLSVCIMYFDLQVPQRVSFPYYCIVLQAKTCVMTEL